jgi:enoyl-CoA hydratase
MVNKVVPREQLTRATRELADKVALVPPVTAHVVKDSINHAVDLMGQRQSWRYHFMVHQWMSNTDTAREALIERKQRTSIKDVVAARDAGQG